MRYQGGGGFGRGAGPAAPQYPQPGAMIDYYLPAESGALTLEILDSAGAVVRTINGAKPVPEGQRAGGGMPGAGVGNAGAAEDEDNPFQRARAPQPAPNAAGLNRYTWDLSYPGPMNAAGMAGGGGPTAVPGKYSVRLTVDGKAQTQSFVLREDPRVAKDGVTLADLRDQFAHNVKVRDLVSDANKVVARLRAADNRLKDASAGTPQADTLMKVRALEAKLLTPPVRYSTPGLQAHITYLYGMTNGADQKVGKDAKERYSVLRRELDGIIVETNKLVGGM
jgi:hypothetical protein